jgi:glyoxylase-like metal-dependent hydrolase (beta-lactamase superfamily II)
MLPKFPAAPPPEGVLTFGPLQFIPGRKGGRYPYCHSLVLTGGETWVVDPGADKDYLGHLARTRRVSAVFISHFHEDHQKYNHLFPEARFYVPAGEVEAFTSMDGVFRLMGIEDPRYRKYWQDTLIKEFRYRPLTDLYPFSPGECFVNGESTLKIIPAPGHTPGHSCFYFPQQQLLYLADVDLSPFGPWYGDATSDLEAFESTLKSLGQFQARTYLTAHEQGVFTFPEFQAGLARFRQVIAAREARLLEVLKTPQTLRQLAARQLIYPKWKEPAFVYAHMEAQMLKKHLARLQRQGRVECTGEGYLDRGKE